MRPRADTLLVWTGAPCSYGCNTCPIDQDTAPAGVQLADLQQGLAEVPARKGRLAVLLGGEPLLRPDLPRLMAAIRSSGCAPGMITTGRPLLYPQVRERLRRFGLAYLRIQLFGTGEVHDRTAAVSGAFDQALAGLRAWMAEAGRECDVDVALSTRGRAIETVISDIEPIARAVASPEVQIVIGLDPARRAELQGSESLRQAVRAFADWNEDAGRPLLAWEGLPEHTFPACGLAIPTLRPSFVAGMPGACCLGNVEDIVTATAASPQEPRANSFNFVRTATSVAWTVDASTCAAHTAADGVELDRHLWLIEGERLVLYVTDTGDFDNAEVARVKDQLSHLFIDLASPGVLDDFTEGMRRVLPDATCDACANRGHCGRRFHSVEGSPFAHEEAWISNYVARLQGRVLDVGCGEQLYRGELEPLVRSGGIEYHGLDPDERSLARLQAELAEGHYTLGGIEDFRDRPASYDHILCLRSLNHVNDPDEALARMAELLRPEGQLLLVECTPFAMLRQPQQIAAADRAPRAGHQHFRNVSSEEILPLVRRRGLHVLHHQAIGLRATNQWVLLLARADST